MAKQNTLTTKQNIYKASKPAPLAQ